ncbi:DUF4192 family protein [Rhodococcus opacus]|uniref:DUF4192 family protein n=1 Tax=Rhodococcus opacus TaxID=37919 RepID=UPI001FF07233|nr:DUF4192 family protein [Rhodococcus opacus]
MAPLDERAFGTVLLAQLPEVVSEADREEWVEVARERVGDIESLLVVVFGSPAHAELVVQALREAAPDRAFHIFAYFQGQARRFHPLPGEWESGDLASHPVVTLALTEGKVRLQTRGEIRAGLHRLSSARSEHRRSPRPATAEVTRLGREDAFRAAEELSRDVIARYLEEYETRGVCVSDEHAARLVAAAWHTPVRDALLSGITVEHGRALGEMWRQVAAVTMRYPAAAPLILAGASFWVGRDAVAAREAISAGLEAFPDHPFGQVMEQMLDAGLNPSMWDQLCAAVRVAKGVADQ